MRRCCCRDTSSATVNRTCEYYGCVPKLTPFQADPATLTPLDESAVNTFMGVLPLTYADPSDLPAPPSRALRIVVISDTHERHREMLIPRGDILVYGGDIQEGVEVRGSRVEAVRDFFQWLNDPMLHPHPVKIVIAGNHDKVIEKMTLSAVRDMAAPALYLKDESALIVPVGLRVFGSPRSTPNSRVSPNRAYQSSAAWAAIPRRVGGSEAPRHSDGEDDLLPVDQHTPLLSPAPLESSKASAGNRERNEGTPSTRRLSVHLEGPSPRGAIDILLTHQTPEHATKTHALASQPIVRFIEAVAPRRLHLGGHLHGSHGLHRVPPPSAVAREYGYTSRNADGACEVSALPFLPSLNASMLKGFFLNATVLPASVIDLEM